MAVIGPLCSCARQCPGQISTFASQHDDQIWACLCTLLGVDPASVTHSSRIGATLPLRLGGLGLSSAVRLRFAAHWASWADCIRMVHQRHPSVARTIIDAVEANDPAQAAQGVVSSINSLRSAGFVIPSWDEGKDPIKAQLRKRTHPSHVLDDRRMQLLSCTKFSWKKNCALSWTSQRRLSCALRVAPSHPSHSLVCPRSGRPPSHLSPSGCSLRLSIPSLHAGAGVAVHSIVVVTTGLRVRGRESWATVAIRWSP